MNLSEITSRVPIIHDIPVNDLWIPPAAALAVYLIPAALRRIFPSEPDNGPLSTFRHQVAQLYSGPFRTRCREPYVLSQILIKDNLHIAVFILATTVLKAEYQTSELRTMPFSKFILIICGASCITRLVASRSLSLLGHSLPRENRCLSLLAQLSEKVACLIDLSDVS